VAHAVDEFVGWATRFCLKAVAHAVDEFVGWATRFCLKAVAHAVSVMQYKLKNNGFSLTEVLMAAGILAIGFAFIAGMFPVGVRLTAIATEQTIAPIVVDEAIAKIKLYGQIFNASLTEPNLVDELKKAASVGNRYVDLVDALPGIPHSDPCEIDEFAYPSAQIKPELKKYHWSALCGLLGDGNVHVIVFVSRRAGAGVRYLTHDSNWNLPNYGQGVLISDRDEWPVPVRVVVNTAGPLPTRTLITPAQEENYITTGSTIVDDATGQVYRVLERIYDDVADEIEIVLDRDWGGPAIGFVWVVPPAVTNPGPPPRVGGRYPCVRVDPTNTIRF